MKKVCVFGAGYDNPTKYFIRNITEKENKIIAFLDNDPEKQGKKLEDIPIYPPEKIQNLDFDYVYTASLFFQEMKEQLLTMGIPEEKIIIPQKRLFHNQPFQDETVRKQAEQILIILDDFFKKNSIKYSFEYGTALGLYRQNGIIPTDNDIDVAIFTPLNEKIIKEIQQLISTSYTLFSPWNFIKEKENGSGGLYNNLFKIDFKLHIKKGIYWDDNVYNNIPTHFFDTFDKKLFLNQELNIPAHIEDYLIWVYGENWRTPHSRTLDQYNFNNLGHSNIYSKIKTGKAKN